MSINTTHGMAASTLAGIGSLNQGTLVMLDVKKKGTRRGKGPGKKVYGDDRVKVLVWSGFSYKALVERSIKKLGSYEGIHSDLLGDAEKTDPSVTIEDVCVAVQEVRSSLLRVVSEPSGRVEPTGGKPPIWEPLNVDGILVRGSKVYCGEENLKDPRAPKPGTIYIDGVKLGEVVIEPAENGQWEAKSKPKTVVKHLLSKMLPTGLYVRYALEPARVRSIKVGKDASAAAVEAGIPIDPESIRQLFKIAS